MPNISFLEATFDVNPLRAQLEAKPHLWNQHRWRTEHARSPHREVSDIWVRYNSIENIGPHFNDPHESVWYPVIEDLPAARSLSEQMMQVIGGQKLGGVLITQVPAGKQVYPHIDAGWHALHYEKFAIQVAGTMDQAFCFEREELCALPGQSYQFNNQERHWVRNESDEDRITLIICIRRSH